MRSLKFSSLWLLVPTLIACSVLNSPAPIFMKYDGIEGEATAPGHVGESDALCFNHSLSRSNTASQPIVNEFVVTKVLDKASPKLAEACASGKHIPQAILTCRKAGATGTNDYYTIVLQDVLVSSYQTGPSCSSDPVPTESLSLNFTKITWTYEPQSADGVPTGPKVSGQWPPASPQ